jgi:hypothetical protein
MLKVLHDPETLFILDIFRWLGDHRDASLLKLDEKVLNNINLIWQESGKWLMVNLGYLDNWRKGKADEPEEGEEAIVEGDGRNSGSVTPQQLQKRFLRMLMFLYELRTEMGTTPVVDTMNVATQTDNNSGDEPEKEAHEVVKVGGPVNVKIAEAVVDMTKSPLSEPLHVSKPVGSTVKMSDVDKAVEKDLEALDNIIAHSDLSEDAPDEKVTPDVPPRVIEKPLEPIRTYSPHIVTLEEGILNRAEQLAKTGQMTGAEYRRAQKMAVAFKSLPSPRDGAETLEQQAKIEPKMLVMERKQKAPDMPEIFDKSMLGASVHEFDKKYIEHVLPKDISNSVLGVQKAGVAVTGYKIDTVHNAGNHYEEHTVRLEPLQGNRSTIKFRVPVVKPNGTFLAGGVQYRQRKQRREIPFRKVNASTVALTSYYGKVYVSRGEKVVNNYPMWLINRMLSNDLIEHPIIADVMISDVILPKDYTTISTKYRSFTAKGIDFVWDYSKRWSTLHGIRQKVDLEEEPNYVLVGKRRDGFVMMGYDNILYHQKTGTKTLQPLGTMQEFLEIDAKKIPQEIVEIEISGKKLPLAIVLCYLLGFHGLLKHLNVFYRHQAANMRLNLEKDEYALRFEDESYIFSRKDAVASMIFGGLNSYDTTLRHYTASSLDLKDTYFNLLDDEGLGVRFLREIDLMNDMFIDPITLEILKDLHDPTDFVGLLFKAADVLKNDWSPEETDMAYMRVAGYERIPGSIYTELVRAIRLQRSRPGMMGTTIELPPFAVWQTITQDPAVSLVEESNPVHNLKEKEEVTYSGTGGRSSRSMVKSTRKFHPSDMGVISEATKDSSDVAITTFMTANPNLVSLRGMTSRYKEEEDGPAGVLSTSALLAPAATFDDPKRVNFISIQQSSGISTVGYQVTPLRTGYEEVIAHRTDDLFAKAAEKSGKVTGLTDKALEVTYKDGSIETIELGRRFGVAAGVTTPHEVVTTHQMGDTIKVGDVLAYNPNFFEPNRYNKGQVLWKAGVLGNVRFVDNVDTLEDSSTISESMAAKLATNTTKTRTIMLAFDQAVHGLVKVGDHVEAESILCTIENPVGATGSLFSEDSLGTLQGISRQNPRAKKMGVVEKVEIFYHGDPETMTESLRELTKASDRQRRVLATELHEDYTTGRVDNTMRFSGDPLAPNTLVIQVYITGLEPMGVGDKLVFGNQMKSIVSRVFPDGVETESGVPVDATFSYQSVSNRIVLSPQLIGTTNRILEEIGKQAADIFFGD